MKLTASLVLAAYWAIGAVAIPTTAAKLGPLEIFHNLPSLPPKWTAHGPANGKTKVHARIGLKQSNIPALQEKLLDISNPDSPNYGKWLSKEERKSMSFYLLSLFSAFHLVLLLAPSCILCRI